MKFRKAPPNFQLFLPIAPIFIVLKNGRFRITSGNTRLNNIFRLITLTELNTFQYRTTAIPLSLTKLIQIDEGSTKVFHFPINAKHRISAVLLLLTFLTYYEIAPWSSANIWNI